MQSKSHYEFQKDKYDIKIVIDYIILKKSLNKRDIINICINLLDFNSLAITPF